MLGCFAKDVEEFLPATTYLGVLQDIQSIESEFQPLCPPIAELSRDSFIYCAAELFRYLRDMALGIPLSQSKPLLKPAKSASPITNTVVSSATPILSGHQHHLDGQPKKFFSGYLVHPGAVLCMMDLLPAVDYDKVVGQGVIESPSSDTPSTMRKKLESDFPRVVATVIDIDSEDLADADAEEVNTEIGRQVRSYASCAVGTCTCILEIETVVCHNLAPDSPMSNIILTY